MSDRHDYLALDWVRGEIQETLNQAQQALEGFVENPDDVSRMRFCQTHLHQVYGTLQMVEFYGAALLAEEMEKLAQALLEARVSNVSDSQETLMRAILQLPPYLERVASNRRDLPVVLLPLLNDLRAARGESLLSETALFSPDLSHAVGQGQVPAVLLNDPRFAQLARKLRQMFQIALLGVLRNDQLAANLAYMDKVFAKLEQISGEAPRAPLWLAGGALVEGLAADTIPLGTSIKLLLGQVDRTLRELVTEGASSLKRPAPADLLKNILYYVAKAELDAPRTNQVKALYRLDDALPSEAMVNEERARMSGPDSQAMSSVVQAISEELNGVKDALEQLVHQNQTDGTLLAPQAAHLKQVADTLAVLGFGQPRLLVEQQLQVMEAMVSGEQPLNRDGLMDVAGALLFVEATLNGMGGEQRAPSFLGREGEQQPGHVSDATEAVLRECRAGLEEAKDGIVEFIASHWQRNHLERVPEKLNGVRGGLEVIQLAKPAQLLRQCVSFIENRLLDPEQPQPDWRDMDTLADAITSVEYYLERLSDDPQSTDEILELARTSVANLGYPLEEQPAPSDSLAADEEQDDLDAAEPLATAAPLPVSEVEDETPAEPRLYSDADAQAESVSAEELAAAAPSNDADDELIDDEIIEIFQEEVDEVLTALDQYFPAWAANTKDESSLAEFRRAFHTLKGSGRMVGATTVGELGWAIENMLNRLIDHTIAPSAMLIALVQEVRNRVPALVDAFCKRQPDPFDPQPLVDAANILAQGGELSSVPQVLADDYDEVAPDATAAVELDGADSDAEDDGQSWLPAESFDVAPTEQDVGAEQSPRDDDLLSLGSQFDEAEDADQGDNEIRLSSDELDAFNDATSSELAASWEQYGEEDDVESIELTLPQGSDDDSFSDLQNLDLDAEPEKALADESASDDLLADIPDLSDWSEGAEAGADDAPPSSEEPAAAPVPSKEEMDPVLLDIFTSEAERNLAMLADWLDSLDMDFAEHPVADQVHRALHTLKGSARMAEIEAMAAVAEPAEKMVKELISGNRPANHQHIELLSRVHHCLAVGLAILGHEVPASLPDADTLISELLQQQAAGRGDAGDGTDPHIMAVFLSEGMDLIMDAEGLLEQWASHPEHTAELIRLREELEMLGASADTAGLDEIATLSVALAGCYQAAEQGRLEFSPELVGTVHEGHEALINMMDCLAAGQTVRAELGLVDILRDLSEGRGPNDDGPGGAVPTLDDSEGGDADRADSFAGEEPPLLNDPTAQASVAEPLDPELVALFLEEAEEILHSSADLLEQWQQGDEAAVAVLQRELHTLKGGARMAAVAPVGDLAHELENLYEGVAVGTLQQDDRLNGLLHQCHDRLAEMIEQLRNGEAPSASPELVSAIQAAVSSDYRSAAPAPESESVAVEDAPAPVTPVPVASVTETEEPPQPERDPELVEIFLEEAEEILESAGTSLESWMEAPDNLIEVQSLQRDLHTLKGGARMSEVPELGDLGHELETLYEGLAQSQLQATPVLFELLHRCHDRLAEMVEALKNERPLPEGDSLIRAIDDYMANPQGFILPDASVDLAAVTPTVVSEPVAPVVTTATDERTTIELPSSTDPEILQIFLEESEELSEIIEGSLTAWKDHPQSRELTADLARALHTLKGGARLAGLTPLGDLSHDFETFMLACESRKEAPSSDDFAAMLSWFDQINKYMEAVRYAASQVVEEAPPSLPAAPAVAAQAVVERSPQSRRDDRRQRQNQAQPQEMVRVGADVLEALVNLAGETSINRGRVEQGISEFSYNVEEMGSTIQRLYEQLRRLDSETEAQIMSNYQKGVDRGEFDEDFDPLEMDQYSELHQITKQLSESASDLLDLKNTLLDRTRDNETLLLQQARINTELQEKLMRTRMVPFSRLVPRLRRIVRQISGEVGKQVDFDVLNPEGELDRSLMERVVAPLEHMLRNAVDHGIETTEERARSGKAAGGRINLELGREGGEVVITLSDDGKGIDTEAVRKKAVERGLIKADAQLSDQDIQQFIFHAGFSTATQVTQISGRGVGMDVVASEIKQMGGSVTIDSHKGQGTRFIIRLPFTLAMNRALMVKAGEDTYAIPLNQIEGIVRVSPFELSHYFDEQRPVYSYVDQDYDLEYLGNFVHGRRTPHLESLTSPLPVLLIRSTEHTVAIVVDGLVGSREVVVKSVGPQLASVAGISGATILGDGSVVVILDIHSLIRAAQAQQVVELEAPVPPQPAEPVEERKEREAPLVMVTDDSVTVRKVTSRLLERHGYRVVTAKDGVDAIAKLEDVRPDIMLLDIEMPRMDGFEVATHVRHNERLLDVPIIMITSRTGDKHRDRAFDIGVNYYMGKPFQENELLSTLRELLAETAGSRD